jgi:hypothetical protein
MIEYLWLSGVEDLSVYLTNKLPPTSKLLVLFAFYIKVADSERSGLPPRSTFVAGFTVDDNEIAR